MYQRKPTEDFIYFTVRDVHPPCHRALLTNIYPVYDDGDDDITVQSTHGIEHSNCV